jgi:hypothetical protein
MDYLDLNIDPVHMIQNIKATSWAKGMGYKIVRLDAQDVITRNSRDTDILFSVVREWGLVRKAFLNNFSLALAKSTMARGWLAPLNTSMVAKIFDYNMNMRRFGGIAEMPEPTFTYLHNSPPHGPYVFDRNGWVGRRGGSDLSGDSNLSQRYIAQLIYVNKKTHQVVDEILSRSPTQPVIIIQGDHGSRFIPRPKPDEPLSDLFLRDSFGNLNAIYLPEYCRGGLYPTISSVNTFRLVFDQCLGASFGLLEDKSFYEGNVVP